MKVPRAFTRAQSVCFCLRPIPREFFLILRISILFRPLLAETVPFSPVLSPSALDVSPLIPLLFSFLLPSFVFPPQLFSSPPLMLFPLQPASSLNRVEF